ncbi:hypothetical protein [Sporolituus thermophilus]|uniref:Uncharacterized protein n=1 Tax=Sporolituus thermophilus DSM 23256 TaxID=1123285 RepID=A0A1G7L245_9FIRM|nr:hypothetical protein [Sporolituus thermophilus]SDF43416.1 hypothetical protein SAMN05660235_01593 [Sporolituus thermophilus DSM 23256]
MEELLKQLVEGQKQIFGRLEHIESAIAGVREELKADIAGVREELKADIADVRKELKADIAAVKAELKEDIATLDAKVEDYAAEQQKDIKYLLELIYARMATKESVDQIAACQAEHTRILNLLSARSIKHEAEIEHLKLAK